MKNKWILILIALISALWLFYSISYRNSQNQIINKYDWLEGKWELNSNNIKIIETWHVIDENILYGNSITIKEKDTIDFEEIRIIKIADDFYYIAKPKSKKDLTAFKITSDSSNYFVSFNKKNEFPKSIAYLRKQDSMMVNLSNDEKNLTFRFKLK